MNGRSIGLSFFSVLCRKIYGETQSDIFTPVLNRCLEMSMSQKLHQQNVAKPTQGHRQKQNVNTEVCFRVRFFQLQLYHMIFVILKFVSVN